MCLPAMRNALPVSKTNGDGQQNVLADDNQQTNKLIEQAMLAERQRQTQEINASSC